MKRLKRQKKERCCKKKVALGVNALYNHLNVPFEQELARYAQLVALRLGQKGLYVACAESCTGGLLSDSLTDIPGSSTYFIGGVVSYQTRIKEEFLQLPAALIEKCGVISDEVAIAMATGIRHNFSADYGIAVTGLAGPGSAEGKKAGRVHVAVCSAQKNWVEKNDFTGKRRIIKLKAAIAAFRLLLTALDEI